ncbi:HK97 family phage prohead protease [Paraburkholderia sediminicola]|uniref:HK97 family phage prohead protease n=1 Tax=Paraburkholderia sediminicola TaxID=458836 RepID=UPI0038B91ABC
MNKDFPLLAIKANANGTFEGYASVYNDMDAYRDVVEPGAFTKSLADYRAKKRWPALLWAHNMAEPIGAYSDIREDSKGLLVAGRLATTGRAAEVRELIGMRAVDGLSIGYRTVREDYDRAANINHLHELALHEISLVPCPALDSARLTSVKSIGAIETTRQAEQTLREVAGLSRAEAELFITHVRTLRDPGTDIDVAAVMATLRKGTFRPPRTR